jgi:formylglycine-generating enzyme required for sulfatase activity
VLSVSWYDAVAFCKWRTATTGSLFRLPTEAEWEKAARGGLEQKLFPWGDEIPHTGERACWHRWMYEIGTLPVGSFAPNGYGLYDMAGNVWEWCSDWYADDYYASISESISESASEEVQKNPAGPETGTFKVRRGAGWNIGEPFRMRCANRGAMPAEQYWPNLGFRCVSPGS